MYQAGRAGHLTRKRSRCKRSNREGMRDRNWTAKVNAFDAYGGRRCACCGETQTEFLTLDHINNDGNIERRKMSKTGYGWGGKDLYMKLRHLDYPAGYQVLCMNCQIGKHLMMKATEEAICPHKLQAFVCPKHGRHADWWVLLIEPSSAEMVCGKCHHRDNGGPDFDAIPLPNVPFTFETEVPSRG
jgi:hypothetical protein